MENIFNELTDKEMLNMILGRSGGKNTIKILDEILYKPQNANQISKKLDLSYNTIRHHIRIIDEYDYIIKTEFKRKYFYYPSDKLLNNLNEYTIIKKYFHDKKL